MNHYIYHIPHLKKVGATSNIQRRMAEHGVSETEYLVLQIATNAKDASVFEKEWQQRLGYPVDNLPYHKTLQISASARYNKKKRKEKMHS